MADTGSAFAQAFEAVHERPGEGEEDGAQSHECEIHHFKAPGELEGPQYGNAGVNIA